MLKIRYTRVGKKDQPHFRVVVAEHSKPVKGKFVEILGHYNPFTKKAVLDKEKIENWLKKGAKPSNAVAKLLQKEGYKHKSIVVIKYNKKPKSKQEAQTNADKTQNTAEKPVDSKNAEKPVSTDDKVKQPENAENQTENKKDKAEEKPVTDVK